jgi:hypothetical protein
MLLNDFLVKYLKNIVNSLGCHHNNVLVEIKYNINITVLLKSLGSVLSANYFISKIPYTKLYK